jgi:multidrug efflux pump subunit AcrA (membrane-fusion protein)
MATGNKSAGLWKKLFRLVLLLGVIIIMILPYPYETGGSFRFLPMERIEIRAQVEGEIEQVLVKEGDIVEEGQELALLNVRDHQKNYDVVNADLDKALADLSLLNAGPKPEEVEKAEQQVSTADKRYEYSQREAERLKSLYETGVTPEEEYLEAAKTADVDAELLEVAKAHLKVVKSGARPEEIEAQEAVVRDLETKLKYYKENISLGRLTAPSGGQVVSSYLENRIGQVLRKGDLFAVLQDTKKIQAEIHVPEADIGEVNIHERVKVKLWAYPTKYFYGKVVSIAPSAENTGEGNIVRVMTEFDNTDGILKPEMTGEAKIKGEVRTVFMAFSRMLVRFFLVEVWSWFP